MSSINKKKPKINKWFDFLKEYSKKNNISIKEAMKSNDARELYKKINKKPKVEDKKPKVEDKKPKVEEDKKPKVEDKKDENDYYDIIMKTKNLEEWFMFYRIYSYTYKISLFNSMSNEFVQKLFLSITSNYDIISKFSLFAKEYAKLNYMSFNDVLRDEKVILFYNTLKDAYLKYKNENDIKEKNDIEEDNIEEEIKKPEVKKPEVKKPEVKKPEVKKSEVMFNDKEFKSFSDKKKYIKKYIKNLISYLKKIEKNEKKLKKAEKILKQKEKLKQKILKQKEKLKEKQKKNKKK